MSEQTSRMRLTDPDAVRSHDWRLIVGGEPRPAISGRMYDNISPVTEDVVCRLPDGGEEDVEAAVRLGQAAARDWARRAPRERGEIVRGLATIVREHSGELAALDAIDVGNAYTPMLGDVEMGADSLEFMADAALFLSGETYNDMTSHLHYTRREPFGVVARIVAFNHPVMFAIQKIAAPLVAGNAVILKPSDNSALSALRMGELFQDVLPKGLLSVLVGKGPDLPRAIVRHPDVKRIGFIGSELTGRAIQRDAADVAVKDISLELGGKNAIIVCSDVDMAAAAEGVVKGMNFRGWQSQSCSSTSRLFVHQDIADELLDEVVRLIAGIRIGNPLDPSTEMGTLASQAQFDKTLRYVDMAREDGAVLVTGGGRPENVGDRGYYVSPTVFDQVDPGSGIAREEVFGPVLSAFRWQDEAEVVRLANSVRYGLTGAIWSNSISRAHLLAHELDTGYIWINDAASHYTGIPFGGYKGSGIGKEESVDELISYTQVKTINLRLAP
ncbi:aldehyde dehydrogenase family protein [Saxibacter everestensis]|uniref:Aldehyde dehydrogenase family protein n=1 Tax=Saxibacter everestensis TaxID=2909229 RepID=A0ABY8QTP9_9MICO|nr:aldehyde dehydrogenase family protein [Brevibacteriaceae bacterium ZFBP1038]